MKTLILNGSPRAEGNTVSLINRLRQDLAGDCLLVNAYKCGVSPCMDCGYCREKDGCIIQDEMQEIYRYIEACDNILIASPIYFSELTGRLLEVGSRLQTYFCRRYFQKREPITKSKKGAVVLVGGGDGKPEKAYETACTLLQQMHCNQIYPLVSSHNTNKIPAMEDEACVAGLKGIVAFFKGGSAV